MSSWSEFAHGAAHVDYFVPVVMVMFGLFFFVPLILSRRLHDAGAEKPVKGSDTEQSAETVPQDTVDLFPDLSVRERVDILLTEWRVLIDMQIHFNEMILRMRTLAVSVVISVFGAAGFAIGQFGNRFLSVAGHDVHVASFVIAFGLVLWVAVFLMDYGYYYRMLVGAVRRGRVIEDAFGGKTLLLQPRLGLFGSARKISQEIGPPEASKVFLIGFYGIVYLAGWLYLLGSMVLLDPQ